MSSREEKISEFCTITGATRSLADSLLTACNDSLEMAINMHMEGDVLPELPPNQDKAGPSGSRKRKSDDITYDVEDEDDVRAPIPQKRETLVQSGYEGYAIRGNHPTRGRVRSVFDGFRNFGNEARSYGASASESSSGAKKSRQKTLEELFKPPLDIMFKGDWQMVRDSASLAKKWLLVNIQDAGEFQCQILNRDVWSSEAVKTILSEHFIFWQQYKEFEEAQRYMTFYPITEWPHVALLDPRTGERLVTWSKIPDAATFCDLISEFLTLRPVFDGDLPVEGSKKKDGPIEDDEEVSIVDATEDEQIQAAIKASLQLPEKPSITISDSGSDFEPFSTDDEDSNMSALSPKKKTNGKTSISHTNGTLTTTTTSSSLSTSASNSNDVESEPKKTPITFSENSQSCDSAVMSEIIDDGSDKSSIIIRFPDGKKVKKDIPCSNKFKVLSDYISSEGFPISSYEIVTNFPKRVLTDLDSSQSLKDMGLYPRETIFVQQKM